MALPTSFRTWIVAPNVRIPAGPVSPLAANQGITGSMQNYLYAVKQLLITTGSYTLKGTGANGTGAMDAVDRWSSAAAIVAGTADPKSAGGNSVFFPTASIGDMAWACVTDKAGADMLIQWWGVKADSIRVSYSPGGLFVTSSYHVSGGVCPTGSDEVHFYSVPNMASSWAIGYNANNTIQQGFSDRILDAWFASDGKSCRFATFGLGGAAGNRWGLEQVYMTTGPGAVVWSGSWGFAVAENNTIGNLFSTYNNAGSNIAGGQASMTVGGTFKQVQLVHGTEMYNSTPVPWTNIKVDAQGGAGYPIGTVGIGGLTAGTTGKFANLIDQWFIQGTNANIAMPGNLLGNKQFIMVGIEGWFWPWDGVTTPLLE